MSTWMLRVGFILAVLGASSLARANGYLNSGVVIGAAMLADQSILVLPLPAAPQVNTLLGQLGVPTKVPQLALYVAPGASAAVAITLDCTQVGFLPAPPYYFWQEFVASGKGLDGKMYGIRMESFGNGNFPLSYLLLTPPQRATLAPSVVSAVGLIDLQLSTLYGTLGSVASNQIQNDLVVQATVTNNVGAIRTAATDCGVQSGATWVQQGLFTILGGADAPSF